MSALATFACNTGIFPDRNAQRYEPERTGPNTQSVLKLPRQRRTDRFFVKHRPFLSDCDPGPTRVRSNEQPYSLPLWTSLSRIALSKRTSCYATIDVMEKTRR